jgi:hypothetical protein
MNLHYAFEIVVFLAESSDGANTLFCYPRAKPHAFRHGVGALKDKRPLIDGSKLFLFLGRNVGVKPKVRAVKDMTVFNVAG